MNIIQKAMGVFKSSAPAEFKSTSFSEGSLVAEAILYSLAGLSPSRAMGIYRKNGSVATAVDMVADAIRDLKPVIQSKNGDTTDDSPVLDLLRRPNGQETGGEFMGKLASHYLITGDSDLAMFGSTRRPPLEVHSVKPQNVNPQQAPDGYAERYTVTDGIGAGAYDRITKLRSVRYISKTGVNEFHRMTRFSSRHTDTSGDSPLQAVLSDVAQQIMGRAHNTALLKNGGRPSLIVTFLDEGGGIDDDEHKSRVRRLNADLGGTSNAGKIAAVSADAKITVKEVGKTNRDMDYIKLDASADLSIFRRFKIPLPLVFTDASTFNNYTSAMEYLYDGAVLPWADAIFENLTKALFPRYGLDPLESWITYDLESVTVLSKRFLENMKIRRELRLETINELRGMFPNREPVKGGEVLYQEAKLIELGTKSEAVTEGDASGTGDQSE